MLSTVKQVFGEEVKDCLVPCAFRREGICSAAPVARNEFSLNSAIANQTQEQVEQGYSASLWGENQVSGVEIKTVDEGESSALPVSQTEKWSSEAIVARSNLL